MDHFPNFGINNSILGNFKKVLGIDMNKTNLEVLGIHMNKTSLEVLGIHMNKTNMEFLGMHTIIDPF